MEWRRVPEPEPEPPPPPDPDAPWGRHLAARAAEPPPALCAPLALPFADSRQPTALALAQAHTQARRPGGLLREVAISDRRDAPGEA